MIFKNQCIWCLEPNYIHITILTENLLFLKNVKYKQQHVRRVSDTLISINFENSNMFNID